MMARKILVLADDPYHPRTLVEPALASAWPAAALEVVDDPDQMPWNGLPAFDLLVIAAIGERPRSGAAPAHWLTDDQSRLIEAFVRAGGGLIGLHGGLASHQSSHFHHLMLGHFLHHPEGVPPVTYAPIGDHPIVKGCTGFTVPDEQYICHVEIESAMPILLADSGTHGATLSGWVRELGSGRVCALTPGHTRESLMDPNFQRMLRQAADWCCRSSEETHERNGQP